MKINLEEKPNVISSTEYCIPCRGITIDYSLTKKKLPEKCHLLCQNRFCALTRQKCKKILPKDIIF